MWVDWDYLERAVKDRHAPCARAKLAGTEYSDEDECAVCGKHMIACGELVRKMNREWIMAYLHERLNRAAESR